MATSRLGAAGAIKGAFEDLMTTTDGIAAHAAGHAAMAAGPTIILTGHSQVNSLQGCINESATAPTDYGLYPSGKFYFNTSDNLYYISNGSAWSPTFAGSSATGDNNCSWFSLAVQYSGLPKKFTVIGNYGKIGDTSAQIAARFDADVIAKSPDFVFIMAGANDTDTSAVIIGYLNSMVQSALASGIRVIIGTIWPNSGWNTADKRQKMETVNAWVRAQKSPGRVWVHDGFSALSTGSNTYPPASILYDGVHAEVGAIGPLARSLRDVFNDIPDVVQTDFPDYATNGTNNIAVNAANYATTAGGNVSGTNGFTVSGIYAGVGPDGYNGHTAGTWGTDTCTGSIEACTDNGGNWWVQTVASGSGAVAGRSILLRRTVSLAAVARSTAYTLHQTRTVGGNLYLCVVAGTTAGTAPTFTSVVGDEIADGTVTWRAVTTPQAGELWQMFYEYEMDDTFRGAGPLITSSIGVQVAGTDYLSFACTTARTGYIVALDNAGICVSIPHRIPAGVTQITLQCRIFLPAVASGVLKIRGVSYKKIE